MGKPGKLFTSLVNGVKAFKSPSIREKSSITNENSSAKQEKQSSRNKQRCMWSLGKSSSRNRSSVGEPLPQPCEVKDVQVQQLSQGFQPHASSFNYTEVLLEEITSSTSEAIGHAEPLPGEPYQEDWATILRLSDESEPEEYLVYTTHVSGLEEQQAAVRIQAAFRRYLAQQHLKRVVRAVISVQAVARGRMIRKQAATTLRCMHAVVKFQARARGWLVRTSELGQLVQQHLEEIRSRELGPLVESRQQEKLKHRPSIDRALDEQLCTRSSRQNLLVMEFKPDEEYWGWAWLDRWMAARPWEKLTSPVAKEQSTSSATAESKKVAEEGAENFVSNVEKENASANSFQTDSYNASANMEKVPPPPPPPASTSAHMEKVHLPPPPPPLPSRVAYPMAKHKVLCETKASETAVLQTPFVTPFATPLASYMTTDNAPSLDETCSVPGASLASELISSAAAHAAEPAELMSLSTSDDLKALQAEAGNPTSSQSSPAPSTFLQESEPSSSPSTTKEEGRWWQENTFVPLHVTDSEMAGEPADVINSDELGMSKTSVLIGALSSTNEEKTGTAPEKRGAGMSASRSNEAGNMVRTEETANSTTADLIDNMREHDRTEEIVKITNADFVDNSIDMRESHAQSEKNGLCSSSGSPTLSEASAKRMSSILVKPEQGDGVSQSMPSYMATTKSSKAKTRSHASPKLMPESPKQRLASPKKKLDSSTSKRTPGSEGKGASASLRPIVHVRTGSKGQSASLADSSSWSLGDSKRHAK